MANPNSFNLIIKVGHTIGIAFSSYLFLPRGPYDLYFIIGREAHLSTKAYVVIW